MADGRDVQWVEVGEGQSGQRVDNFLMARLKGFRGRWSIASCARAR